MSTIPSRAKIKVGLNVQIIQKHDQQTGNLTEGIVKRILTSSRFHPHGIKVELDGGKSGRSNGCNDCKKHRCAPASCKCFCHKQSS